MTTRKVVKGEEVEYEAEAGVSLRKFGGRVFRVFVFFLFFSP